MKPSIPKGTRDFLPSEVYKREFIFNIIKKVFQKYGYVPIETPTMENLDTRLGLSLLLILFYSLGFVPRCLLV